MSKAVVGAPRDAYTTNIKRRQALKTWGIYLLMALVIIALLFPFYWMILTSFRSQVDNTSPVPVWFFVPTLKNYANVIQGNNFLEFTWNSLVIASLSTGLGLVLGLPAAYSIARFKQNGLRARHSHRQAHALHHLPRALVLGLSRARAYRHLPRAHAHSPHRRDALNHLDHDFVF